VLCGHAEALVEAATQSLADPASLDLIRSRYTETLQLLDPTPAEQTVASA
jgi:hypothetical protein